MAKKIQIDIEINGKMQKATVEAKKLNEALKQTGRSAGETDRRLKGAAQATSNSSKEFAKMSQGMGGLVGIYATIAANVFAVSSAFQFLKSVADFRVIQDSQTAFASSTGVALRTLTSDIRQAADGMLTFQDASQAAAIGAASGLSGQQLTDLAKGAASVSKILGRDVTDSFNRLVRGVTKAEPELLDELGITLRLEDATNKYAIAIGKNVKALSTYERKQAIAADVQDQLNKKFIIATDAVDVQENAITKLSIAFSDVLNSVKGFLGGPVEGLANFLTENITSLIAVMGLFAAQVTKTMLPPLNSFAESARNAANEAKAAFDQALASRNQFKGISTPQEGVRTTLAGLQGQTKSKGIAAIVAGKDPTKRQAAALLRMADAEKGIYNDLTKYQQQVYKKHLRTILGETDTTVRKLKRAWYGMGEAFNRTTRGVAVVWKATMFGMQKVAVGAITVIDKAFRLAGIVGLFLILKDIVVTILEKLGFDFSEASGVSKFAADVKALTQSLEDLNSEYGKLTISTVKFMDASGQAAGSGTPLQVMDKLGKVVSTVIPKFEKLNELASLEPAVRAASRIAQGEDFAGGVGGYIGSFFSAFDENAIREARGQAQRLASEVGRALFAAEITSGADTPEVLRQFDAALREIAQSGVIGSDILPLLRQMGSEFEELQGRASAFLEEQKNIDRQFQKMMQNYGTFSVTGTELMESVIAQLSELLATTESGIGLGSLGGLFAADQLGNLRDQFNQLFVIQEKETKLQKTKLQIERKYRLEMRKATPLIKARLKVNQDLDKLGAEINDAELTLGLAMQKNSGVSEEKLAILREQLANLYEQRDVLEDSNDFGSRLGQAFSDSLEKNLQNAIVDVILQEEKNIGDAIANLVMGIAQSLANILADMLTEAIMSVVFKIDPPDVKMKRAIEKASENGAKAYEDAIKRADDEFIKKMEELKKALQTGGGGGSTANATQDQQRAKAFENLSLLVIKDDYLQVILPEEQVARIAGETTGESGVTKIGGKLGTMSMEGTENLPKIEENTAETVLSVEEQTEFVLKALKDLDNEILNQTISIEEYLSETNRLLNLLKGKDLTKDQENVGKLGELAKNLITLGSGGDEGRYGGIFSRGSKMPGYAAGGIAKGPQAGYPATLHGTEAVVPLPNGNAIPVDMRGAAQQNNVVVNVNVDNSGEVTQDSKATERDTKAFGEQISLAIQKEIQIQKRAGGLLNANGVG